MMFVLPLLDTYWYCNGKIIKNVDFGSPHSCTLIVVNGPFPKIYNLKETHCEKAGKW